VEQRAASVGQRAATLEKRASLVEQRAGIVEQRAASVEQRAAKVEQRGERSSVPSLLRKPGAEAKNQDNNNTRIHSTSHWTRKSQVLPSQI
jgi:hypothetical protein